MRPHEGRGPNSMRRFARPGAALAILTTLGLVGCGDSSTSPDPVPGPPGGTPIGSGIVVHEGLEYEAVVQVMESFPVQLAGDVTLANRGDETVRVTFPDGCVALLRAFEPGGRSPVWDQGHEVGCTMALVPVELEPGESVLYRTPVSSARDVVGDDLPDGVYRIAVYLRPNGETIEIDAGSVELAIPR